MARSARAATVIGLQPGTAYSFAVFPIYAHHRHGKPGTVHATTTSVPALEPPAPVTDLTATSTSPTLVQLGWTVPAPTPGVSPSVGITVRRATGSQAPTTTDVGTPVTNLDAGAAGFDDTTVSSGTTYTYAVFTYDATDRYSPPAVVTVTTPGPADTTAPGLVTAVAASVTSSTATLTWANPSDADLAAIQIRRATGDTPPASTTGGDLVIDDAPTATTFTDSALTPGDTYSYALFSRDGAGNTADPAIVTVTLPSSDSGDDHGVVPLPTTVQPAARLIQDVTDNADGTHTIVLGPTDQTSIASTDPRAESRADSAGPMATQANGVGVGGNPCVIYGIVNANTTLKANAVLAAPSAAVPYGYLGRPTDAAADLSGTRCRATGPTATLDQAYSAFDPQETGLQIKPDFQGGTGAGSTTDFPLVMGCTGSTGTAVTLHGNFTDTHVDFHAHLHGDDRLGFTIDSRPVFTADVNTTGTITCEANTSDLGLYIPIPGTPLMFEFKPDASITLQGGVHGTVTFTPHIHISTSNPRFAVDAAAPTVATTNGTSLDATAGLSVSLSVGGGKVGPSVGIRGTFGPELQLPDLPSTCGTLSLAANLSLYAHVFFSDWTAHLASWTPLKTLIGPCGQITTTNLPDATVGQPYTTDLTTADHLHGTWTISGDTPPGLTLTGYTLAGIPTHPGDYALPLTFTDDHGATSTAVANIKIGDAGESSTGDYELTKFAHQGYISQISDNGSMLLYRDGVSVYLYNVALGTYAMISGQTDSAAMSWSGDRVLVDSRDAQVTGIDGHGELVEYQPDTMSTSIPTYNGSPLLDARVGLVSESWAFVDFDGLADGDAGLLNLDSGTVTIHKLDLPSPTNYSACDYNFYSLAESPTTGHPLLSTRQDCYDPLNYDADRPIFHQVAIVDVVSGVVRTIYSIVDDVNDSLVETVLLSHDGRTAVFNRDGEHVDSEVEVNIGTFEWRLGEGLSSISIPFVDVNTDHPEYSVELNAISGDGSTLLYVVDDDFYDPSSHPHFDDAFAQSIVPDAIPQDLTKLATQSDSVGFCVGGSFDFTGQTASLGCSADQVGGISYLARRASSAGT